MYDLWEECRKYWLLSRLLRSGRPEDQELAILGIKGVLLKSPAVLVPYYKRLLTPSGT